MGKTICALTALVELGCKRTLIVAPKRVAETVWHKEAAAWEHTAHLKFGLLTRSAKYRLRTLREANNVEVVSYENLIWLKDTVDIRSRYDAVILDELSKIKNPGTARFRQIRSKIVDIPVRFGLTGTPVGNHLLGVWGELFMVAGAAPFGRSYDLFRRERFHTVDFQARIWAPNPGTAEWIQETIRPYAFSVDEAESPLALPTYVFSEIQVPMPTEAQTIYDYLRREGEAALLNGMTVQAFAESAISNKLRQISSGFVYTEGGGVEILAAHKLQVLAELQEEQQGNPMLVFYWFRQELDMLRDVIRDARVMDSPAEEERWNRGQTSVLLAHPSSAGHGLNLQHGGHTVVWYTAPWSLELFQQGNGRLRRHGQKSLYVPVITLCGSDIERRVAQRLAENKRVEDALLEAVCMRGA